MFFSPVFHVFFAWKFLPYIVLRKHNILQPVLFNLGAMFLVLAALHAICALVLLNFGGTDRLEKGSQRLPHGFAVIRRSAYLKQVALVVALASGFGALLDYAMKVEAARHFANADTLVSFFAAFYTITGVLTFAVQRGLGDQTLRRIGLGATISVLPFAALLGGAIAAAAARLSTTVAAKGAEVILANSFFRSGVELLYAPLPAPRKRAAKVIVDVIAQRTGDLLGGGFILLVIAFLPAAAEKIVLLSACVLAAAGFATVARLHRGYIEQLTESLKRGLASLQTSAAVDPATEDALAQVQEVDRLLDLDLDREAVEVALRGWLSDDLRMRGTAVEYFENVLPESLRNALAERLPLLRENASRARDS
ncbi:MAG: Npt1/Npt2 family nucleotide transporter [Deltaproteobacteria bacterium]